MKMELDQPAAVSAHHFFMTRYKIPQLQCGDEFYARNTYFDAYLLMSQLTKFERASCKLQNDTCTTKIHQVDQVNNSIQETNNSHKS